MDSLIASLAHYGAWFVGSNVFLQQLGLPVPAVPTLVVAGALGAAGKLGIAGALAAAIVASVVADLAWYFAGRRYGYQVLRFLCRVSLSPDTCVRETEGIFERWGFYSLIVSKFVPGFSTVGPPIAGALRMPIGRFTVAAAASAFLWAGAALVAGWLFAPEVEFLLAWTAAHIVLATTALAAALAIWIGARALRRWRLARHVDSARIHPHELRERLSGDASPLVVDVGSTLAHQSRPHIRGAQLMDLDRIAREAASFPRDRDIVFYCACPNEESARRAAQILLAKGFTRVRPLVGGIDAWVAMGGEVEHGVPMTFVREAEAGAPVA
jgi:membrane protein DedA with SNARE-associated domain/rhodanese-related sulfurtransferase